MPYTNVISRRKTGAIRARRHRLFTAAVRAGHPKAIDAARQRDIAADPMRPERELYAQIAAMPAREDRQARKAEYLALRERCLSGTDAKAAQAVFKRLRAEVVAEMEAAAVSPPAPVR